MVNFEEQRVAHHMFFLPGKARLGCVDSRACSQIVENETGEMNGTESIDLDDSEERQTNKRHGSLSTGPKPAWPCAINTMPTTP